MSRRKQQNPTRLPDREGGEIGPVSEADRHGGLSGAQSSNQPALQDSFLRHISDIQRLQEQTQSLLNNAQKTQNILDTQASQMYKVGVPVDPSHMHSYTRTGPGSPPSGNNSLFPSHLVQPPFRGNVGFMPMPLGMMGLPIRPGMPVPPMLSPLFSHPGLVPAVVGKTPVERASGSQSTTRQTVIPGDLNPHSMAGLQEGLTLEQLKVIQDIVSKFPKEKSVGPRIVAPSPELVQAWQNALHSPSQSALSPGKQDGKSSVVQGAEHVRKWQQVSHGRRADEELPAGGGVDEGGNVSREKMPTVGEQQGLIHNGSNSVESFEGETPLASESAETELHSSKKSRSNFLRAERVGSLGYWTPGRPRRGRTFHTCHICGKVFRRPSEVQRHLRVHTGEQPFQCDLCYRRFNDKSNWRNHMIRVHRIESPVWPTWSQEGASRKDTFLQRASDSEENGELSDEASHPEVGNSSQMNSEDMYSSMVQHGKPTEEMSVEGVPVSHAAEEQEGVDSSATVTSDPQAPQMHLEEEEENMPTDLTVNKFVKDPDFVPHAEMAVKVEDRGSNDDGGSNNHGEYSQQDSQVDMSGKVTAEGYEAEMGDIEERTALPVKQELPSPEQLATTSQYFLDQYEDQEGMSQGSFDDTADTDSERKIYHCETCQKPFSRVDSLRRHRICHTGIKPHGCRFCTYRTYYKGNLNVHMDRAHSSELQEARQRGLFQTFTSNQAVSPSSQYVDELSVADSMVELPASNSGIYSNPVLSNQMFGLPSNQMIDSEGSGLPSMEDCPDEDVEDTGEDEAVEEESQATMSLQTDAGISNISQNCNICGETFDPDNLTAEMVHHAAMHQTNKNCNICGETFDPDNLTAEMVHHAAMHQTNKVSHDVFYSCNMCKAKFRSREGLENHKEQIHQSEVYGRMITKVSESYMSYMHTSGNSTGKIVTKYFHRCNLCGKKFDRPSGALRHTRVHTGEKPFTCRICGMPFQDKSGLKAHTLRKHPEVVFNTAPGSELSPENYKTLSHINSQLNSLHGSGEPNFSINDEDQGHRSSDNQESWEESQDSLQTSSSSLLQTTTEIKGEVSVEKDFVEDMQNHSSNQPNLSLSGEDSHADEISTARSGPVKKVSETAYWPKRKKGNKKLARMAAVLLNGAPREGIPKGSIPVFRKGTLSLVRADDLKPNACTICGKRFWYKYDLRRHMTMHSDFRPYKCKFCNYRSRQMNQLKIHMQRHKGVRPFRCPACDFSASSKPEMKAHVARHLTIWTNHICQLCYYGFRTKEDLSEHQSTKHGSVEGGVPSQICPTPQNPPSLQQAAPTLVGTMTPNPFLVPAMAGIPGFPQGNHAVLAGTAGLCNIPTTSPTDSAQVKKEVEGLDGGNTEDVGTSQANLVIQDIRSLHDSESNRESILFANDNPPSSKDDCHSIQAEVQDPGIATAKGIHVTEEPVDADRTGVGAALSLSERSGRKRKDTSTEIEMSGAKLARSEGMVQSGKQCDAAFDAGMNLALRQNDDLVLCRTGHSPQQDIQLTPGHQLEFWVTEKAIPQCNGNVAERETMTKCNGAFGIEHESIDSGGSMLADVDYRTYVETRVVTRIERVEMKCKTCSFSTVDLKIMREHVVNCAKS